MSTAEDQSFDQLGPYIDGKTPGSSLGPLRAVEDPSSKKVIASVADSTADQIDEAVAVARACFEGTWSQWTPSDRAELLRNFRSLVARDYAELARLETLEMGAPIRRVPVSMRRALGLLDFNAASALTYRGAYVPNSASGDITTYVIPEPVGVVAAITPWNAPINAVLWKIAPAIAVGCTVVVKPSELTPLCALRLADLLAEAGAPEGLVNVLPGGGEVGAALVKHTDVDKIAFTGSTATGQTIVRDSGINLKRLSLELGGKSANIVFADADLDAAAQGAAAAAFGLSGQACVAGSRLFVHSNIVDQFVDRLSSVAGAMKLGPGIDPDTVLGPLVSEIQLARVQGYLDGAKAEGCELAVVGRLPTGGSGYYMPPTLVLGSNDGTRITQEEVFGPVVSILSFDEEDEVVQRANSLPYGLAAGVWSQNIGTVRRMSRRLKAGTIWVNCYSLLDPQVPFGGIKMSGFGRESGSEHIAEFISPKAVWISG